MPPKRSAPKPRIRRVKRSRRAVRRAKNLRTQMNKVTGKVSRSLNVTGIQKVTRLIADSLSLPSSFSPLRLPGPGIAARPTSSTGFTALSTYQLPYAGVTNVTARILHVNSPSAPIWVDRLIPDTFIAFGTDAMEFPSATTVPVTWAVSDLDAYSFVMFSTDAAAAMAQAQISGHKFMYIPRNIVGAQPNHLVFYIVARDASNAFCSSMSGSINVMLQVSDGTNITSLPLNLAAATVAPYGFAWTAGITLPDRVSWVRVDTIATENTASVTFAAATTACRLTAGIYYGDAAMTTTGHTAKLFGLAPLQDTNMIENTQLAIYSAGRLNASSLLMSNVTKVINKEGFIRCARLPLTSLVNPFSLTSIRGLPPNLIKTLVLEKGAYNYLLPGELSDFVQTYTNMVNEPGLGPFGPTTNTIPAPLIYMDTLGYSNLMILEDDDTSTPSTFSIQYNNHLEFTSSSQIFQTGISTLELEDLRKALRALEMTGVFFENPAHFGALVTMVSSAVRAAWPLVQPAFRAAVAAGGEVLVNSMANLAISRMRQSRI